MGVDVVIGIVASVFTTITSCGWLIERGGKRIDKIINHMEKVESILNEMRADLPVKYTMKEEHLRLYDKVEKIENHIYQWGRRPHDDNN
jgi:hypothetical protein